MKHIAPREAFELMETGVPYVDVRTEIEFESGHPRGAYNLPISEADFAAIALAHFDKDAPIVVGCKSGHRSVLAAKTLESEGFTQVMEQLAGWDGARDAFGRVTEPGWRKSGLPSEVGLGQSRSLSTLRERSKA